MTSVKFIDLLSDVKNRIFEKKYDKQTDKLIFQLRVFDKSKPIVLHKRDFYNDKFKKYKIEDEYDIVDNVVIFKNKFITLDPDKLKLIMADILDTFDIINESDPNEDIYQLACKLFHVPGNLLVSEVDQLYCEV